MKAYRNDTMSAQVDQIGGDHYKTMPVQPWEAIEVWLTPEEVRGYHKATVTSYLAREHKKGGDDDIRKAHHHLTRLVELLDNPTT